MAKHGESEGEVLSREEMKSTKGGAGIPTADLAATAFDPALSAEEQKRLQGLDPALASEAANIQAAPPVVGVNAPPPLPKR
jgi:hypothetical protein